LAKMSRALGRWAVAKPEVDPMVRSLEVRRDRYRMLTNSVNSRQAVDIYNKINDMVVIANGNCRERTLTTHLAVDCAIDAALSNSDCINNGGTVRANSYGYPWTTSCCSATIDGDYVIFNVWRGKPGVSSTGIRLSKFTLQAMSISCTLANELAVRRARMYERYDLKGGRVGVAIAMPKDLYPRFGVYEHGITYQAAKLEIARKRGVLSQEIKERGEAKRNERRARLFARIANISVNYNDIRSVGACDPGITSWCNNNGVDKNASLPLSALAKNTVSAPYAIMVARKILSNIRNSNLTA
jgi:hypothetical protein